MFLVSVTAALGIGEAEGSPQCVVGADWCETQRQGLSHSTTSGRRRERKNEAKTEMPLCLGNPQLMSWSLEITSILKKKRTQGR